MVTKKETDRLRERVREGKREEGIRHAVRQWE